jgi:hypothetical protein
MNRRRPPSGLLEALRVVESLPRLSGQASAIDDSSPFVRGYSAGLWDARAAIMRQIHLATRESQ